MPSIGFGGLLTFNNSWNDDFAPDSTPFGFAQNPLIDSQEVKGGIKIAASDLDAYMNEAAGGLTLRSLSSIAYDTTDEVFKVYDSTNTPGWYPMSDYLGVSSLKIQLPGGENVNSTPPLVTNDVGLLETDRIRVGVDDGSGLIVSLSNEVGDPSYTDTFRLALRNSNNFGTEYDVVSYQNLAYDLRVPMWIPDPNGNNTGGYFVGSPISVESDGTNSTVNISGGLDVTGAINAGTNTTAASLDVTNKYIKCNDGYESTATNVAAAQGGLLVQTGVDDASTPGAYYQQGFFWDAVDGHWRRGSFESSSTGTNAVYTETGNVSYPVLEYADATDMYFTTSGDTWSYYYPTPSSMFTYHSYGSTTSDYDIDGDANVSISNQSMTLDGTAITSESSDVLIAGSSSLTSGFSTFNKVRTARIITIRAIATDDNATNKKLVIELPDSLGYNELLMISVYQLTGSETSHTRQEIFGAEFVDGADNSNDSIFEIRLNQAGLSAGDVFDIVVVV